MKLISMQNVRNTNVDGLKEYNDNEISIICSYTCKNTSLLFNLIVFFQIGMTFKDSDIYPMSTNSSSTI